MRTNQMQKLTYSNLPIKFNSFDDLFVKNKSLKISVINQPYVDISKGKIQKKLIMLQLKGFLNEQTNVNSKNFLERLSMVQKVNWNGGSIIPTAAFLEGEKVSKSWNVNYLSHGWHRYVGRFPPHV